MTHLPLLSCSRGVKAGEHSLIDGGLNCVNLPPLGGDVFLPVSTGVTGRIE